MAVVTQRTGIPADVIRAWERRYRAIEPIRSSGNQRLYSEAQVGRLVLIRSAVDRGWKIGQLAALEDAQIRALLAAPGLPSKVKQLAQSSADDRVEQFVALCLAAIRELDRERLRAHLEEASIDLGRIALLDGLLVRLLGEIGERYVAGDLRIIHEHLATVSIASFLDGMHAPYRPAAEAQAMVATTPVFQNHDVGAMLAAAVGRMEGWRSTFLGPNLPAEEIAAAARQHDARIIALSIIFPANDPALAAELERLGRLVDGKSVIVVGGASAASYGDVLNRIGARQVDGLPALRAVIRSLH